MCKIYKNKSDLKKFIKSLHDNCIDDDYLCLHCEKCIDYVIPDDCIMSENNTDCMNAFIEMQIENTFI